MTTKPRQRTIRSFVKRTGRMTPSQERALSELWPSWGVAASDEAIDFDRVFGRQAERVLEIGFGNGDSLVALAERYPELDFLGIEVHEPGIGHCLLEIDRAGIENLRLMSHDAIDVLMKQVPESSLARVNLYFPDPWPKKRHHKRRIVNDAFLELVADRLDAGGALHIATDWENYAEHIDEALSRSSRFVVDERRVHDGGDPLDRPATKFERRGLKLGHQIWDWRLLKT